MEYLCIYCKHKSQEKFNREHVIPQFLGKFEPVNPVISGLVCSDCNLKFSRMERKFKADSSAGILCQMFNLENKEKITIHNNRVKNTFSYQTLDVLFNGQFPFLKAENGEIKFFPVEQVIINDKKGGFTVFLPEQIQKLKKQSREYKKVAEEIKKKYDVRSGISIFAEAKTENDASRLETIIKWLEEFNIHYNEVKRVHAQLAKEEKRGLEVSQNITVDKEIGAVLAKIAFNYLAYSAEVSGQADKLFNANFDQIRAFIQGDSDIEMKSIVTKVSDDPIMFIERDGKRLIVFLITFKAENNKIISRISFFGREVFDIVLGEIPIEWDRPDFGSGHAFDPFNNQILSLTQVIPLSSMTEVSAKFGLFRRLITTT